MGDIRKLATIRKIQEIRPIEGADQIEVAVVDGWQVIIRKDESFKVGDLVIYCEIDSFLPIHSSYEFLRKSSYKKLVDGTEGFRLRTMKMKGELSQGLILPLTSIRNNPDYLFFAYVDDDGNLLDKYFIQHHIDKNCIDLEEGLDVTEILGITKYDSFTQVLYSGSVKGSFPSCIPKTDEERVQNLLDVIEQYKHTQFCITEKLDGTSFTCYLKDGEFGVCSRNLELKEEELVNGDYDRYWKIARKLNLKEKLESLSYNIALQGELVGPGI